MASTPSSVPPPTLQSGKKCESAPPSSLLSSPRTELFSPPPNVPSGQQNWLSRWETWYFHHFNFLFFNQFSFRVWKFLLYFSETGSHYFLATYENHTAPSFAGKGKPPPMHLMVLTLLSLKIYSAFIPLDSRIVVIFENLLSGSCMRSKASTSQQDEGGCKSFPCTTAPGVFSCSLPRKPGFQNVKDGKEMSSWQWLWLFFFFSFDFIKSLWNMPSWLQTLFRDCF